MRVCVLADALVEYAHFYKWKNVDARDELASKSARGLRRGVSETNRSSKAKLAPAVKPPAVMQRAESSLV